MSGTYIVATTDRCGFLGISGGRRLCADRRPPCTSQSQCGHNGVHPRCGSGRVEREQLHEINSDQHLLEKFAREKYLMNRDNEDIFVLVPKKK